MINDTSETGKPRYSIDLSRNKYDSRYDRLLNILFHCHELPSDLFGQMNMTYDNFRKSISILKKRGLLSKISQDGAVGYILTTQGKKLTRQLNYMKYRDCLNDESRQYDIKRRKRKRQFAYLYALFDRAGIPYEIFAKPSIDKVTIMDDNVYFYTALDLKRMLGIESTAFKGSRLLGFLIGRGRIIPVYRTSYLLKTFGRHETLVPIIMNRYFSAPVSTAVLICNGDYSAVNIINQIIENTGYDYKGGVNTANYDSFFVFPSDDSFLSRFDDLYTDSRETKRTVIDHYGIDTSDTDSNGGYRYKQGTGYIQDNPVLVCAGNVNVVELKRYIYYAKRNDRGCYILCQKRDFKILEATTKEYPIRVIDF